MNKTIKILIIIVVIVIILGGAYFGLKDTDFIKNLKLFDLFTTPAPTEKKPLRCCSKELDKCFEFLPNERLFYQIGQAYHDTFEGWTKKIYIDADIDRINELQTIFGNSIENFASCFTSSDHTKWRRVYMFKYHYSLKANLDKKINELTNKLKDLNADILDLTNKYNYNEANK